MADEKNNKGILDDMTRLARVLCAGGVTDDQRLALRRAAVMHCGTHERALFLPVKFRGVPCVMLLRTLETLPDVVMHGSLADDDLFDHLATASPLALFFGDEAFKRLIRDVEFPSNIMANEVTLDRDARGVVSAVAPKGPPLTSSPMDTTKPSTN